MQKLPNDPGEMSFLEKLKELSDRQKQASISTLTPEEQLDPKAVALAQSQAGADKFLNPDVDIPTPTGMVAGITRRVGREAVEAMTPSARREALETLSKAEPGAVEEMSVWAKRLKEKAEEESRRAAMNPPEVVPPQIRDVRQAIPRQNTVRTPEEIREAMLKDESRLYTKVQNAKNVDLSQTGGLPEPVYNKLKLDSLKIANDPTLTKEEVISKIKLLKEEADRKFKQGAIGGGKGLQDQVK